MPPQEDMSAEESKEQPKFDLFTHITKEGRAYISAMTMVALSLEADIKDLVAKKRDIEKVVNSLGKHQEFSKGMLQLISEFDEKIKRLGDKVAVNKD